MPIDPRLPNILHCFVCQWTWKRRAGKPLPKSCPNPECHSVRWLDGTDRRMHVQDCAVRAIGQAMAERANAAIRNLGEYQRLVDKPQATL